MRPAKRLLIIPILIFLLACNSVQYIQGERLYKQHCEHCHMAKGEGVANLYPALIDISSETAIEIYPCIIRNGYKSNTKPIEMLGIPHLTDVEITNIINYLLNDLNQLNVDIELPQTKKWAADCVTSQ